MRAPWVEPTGIVSLSSGISRFKDSSVCRHGCLGSGVSGASKGGEHPRVLLGQPKLRTGGDGLHVCAGYVQLFFFF